MTIQEQSVEDHAYGLNGVSEEPDDRDDEGNDETENTTIHDPSSNGVLSNNKKNKKKKKKRKAKKASATGEEGRNRFIGDQEAASSVKIARNKHMRYISSYHVRICCILHRLPLYCKMAANARVHPWEPCRPLFT